MLDDQRTEKFRQIVENKFQIYNSLFMSLPYDKMTNIGMLLPFLYEESKDGYQQGKSPIEIVEEFFTKHSDLENEEQKLELLFKIIQYIERQVVLFDSIEDAAFSELHSESDAGTLLQIYERALQENKLSEISNKLDDFAVRVVFTAHPTQFYPNAVQRILHDLRKAINTDSVTEIDMLLQQLGKTPFVNQERPTPLDEAMSIIYYLRYVYYETIGELYQKLKNAFGNKNFTPNPNTIQLGFWPGGDRDGNPFVTAEITQKVADELNITILKCYYEHLKKLRRRLSFRGVSEVLEELSQKLYNSIFRNENEISETELLQSLDKAEQILIEKHNGLFKNLLDEFKDSVKIFGTHFASLDIRQDSRIHQQVIENIIEKNYKGNISELSQNDRWKFLAENDFNFNLNDFEGITKET
ncbi:MAG: phosphoenolpyruvate carboxylase, partial [Cruoricaptor ignavus]|nr:phosphoenolpyruvate carboxylase [Cruoricaptor ignavus]